MNLYSINNAEWAFHEAGRLAGIHPYIWDGGHNVLADPVMRTFPPTRGENPEGTNPKGYDCSGWLSAICYYAGILNTGGVKEQKMAINTKSFSVWGESGHGKYMTILVRNSGGVEHCFAKFTMPGHPPIWTAGAHTGTICGWQNYTYWDYEALGYLPRHASGL